MKIECELNYSRTFRPNRTIWPYRCCQRLRHRPRRARCVSLPCGSPRSHRAANWLTRPLSGRRPLRHRPHRRPPVPSSHRHPPVLSKSPNPHKVSFAYSSWIWWIWSFDLKWASNLTIDYLLTCPFTVWFDWRNQNEWGQHDVAAAKQTDVAAAERVADVTVVQDDFVNDGVDTTAVPATSGHHAAPRTDDAARQRGAHHGALRRRIGERLLA